MTQEEKTVLDQLLVGNERYVEGITTAVNRPDQREVLALEHAPMAAILRCSDARVAPELIFDQPLGKLFVCGVAGNVPTTEIIESLEYAVVNLRVSLILVAGHASCGAVVAALDSNFPQGLFSQIALSPNFDLDQTIALNAKHGAKVILDRSALILDAVESGNLCVAAGVQNIASGRFTVLDCYQN